MGHIISCDYIFTTITRWIPDIDRLQRLKKVVHGPLQQSPYKRRRDQTGKHIIPTGTKRHVIKKYINSYGETIKIYDTDEVRILDKVFNKYSLHSDVREMLKIIQRRRKVPKDKYGEEFVKIIYTIDEVEHIYTQKQLYEFYWKQ